MKQLTKILVLAIVLISIGFIGCKKQIGENQKNDNNLQRVNEENSAVQMPKLKIFKGAIKFKSIEQFQKTINVLDNMTDNERISWENKFNFYSLDRKIENIYDDLDNALSKKEFLSIINQNKDLFRIEVIGGDTVLTEKIDNPMYKYISDENAMYIISNKAYKVIGNKILVSDSKNFDKVKKIKSCNNLYKDITVYKEHKSIIKEKEQKKSQNFQYTGYINNMGAYAYFVTQRKKHRKLKYYRILCMKVINYTGSPYGPYYQIKIWGLKYNFGCWYRYRTNLTLNRKHAEIDGKIWGFKQYFATNSREIWKQYFYKPQSARPFEEKYDWKGKPFTNYSFSATSRGITGYYVRVNYNY